MRTDLTNGQRVRIRINGGGAENRLRGKSGTITSVEDDPSWATPIIYVQLDGEQASRFFLLIDLERI